jgi:cytochrome oxidase assembly protein ShyY1
MSVTPATPRSAIAFGVFTLVMVALFTGLGLWQLQRRVEKHALIAHLIERLAAAPDPLPSPSRSGAHNPAHDEFRRVSFTVTYAALPDAMVYSSSSAVRDDVSGRGTWAFLPARLPGGETAACRIEW